MSTDLTGRVALVTGAAGDLGRAIAAELTRRGAKVVGVDRCEGADVDVIADVADPAGNSLAVAHAVDRHGQLDVVVCNAGVQHLAALPDFPAAEWERLLGVMLTGPFLLMQAAWQQLVRQPGGRIVVTASTSSFVAEAFKAAYVAAKHGVLGLVKVAALEGAPHGLTANAVAPAWMHTAMATGQLDERARLLGSSVEETLVGMANAQPSGRFVDPVEVAATIGFLASPAASGVNGACVPVDLGALA